MTETVHNTITNIVSSVAITSSIENTVDGARIILAHDIVVRASRVGIAGKCVNVRVTGFGGRSYSGEEALRIAPILAEAGRLITCITRRLILEGFSIY